MYIPEIITATIYHIQDDDGIFYVGCTTQPLKKRLAAHLSSHKKANTAFGERIRRSCDFSKITIHTIVQVTGSHCDISGIEYYFIDNYMKAFKGMVNVSRLILKNGHYRMFTNRKDERKLYNL